MRAFCAVVFALLLAGAYAQDNIYSHIVAGKFRRAGFVATDGFAKWDTSASQWFSPAISRVLGGAASGDGYSTGFSIKDVELHPTSADLVYLITSDTDAGGKDRVVQYTISTDTYLPLGEEFDKGTLNDLVVTSDTLYLCGTFSKTRPFDQTVPIQNRAYVDVEKIAQRSLATTDNKALWQQIPNTPVSKTMVDCGRLFVFGQGQGASPRFVIAAPGSNQVYWKATATPFEWSNNPSDAAIGSNIRLDGANAVSFGATYWDGTTLYVAQPTGANFFTVSAGSDAFSIMSTTNGFDFNGALLIDPNYRNNEPRAFGLVAPAPFVIHNGASYYPMSRANNTHGTYYSIFTNPVSANKVIPTKFGNAANFLANGDNINASPFTGPWLKVDSKLIIVSAASNPVYYEEVSFPFSEAPEVALGNYRKANLLSQVFSVDLAAPTAAPVNELGGAVTGGGITKLLRSGTTIWAAGSFTKAWNKWFLGLAGYNEKKGWVALGDPLQDWLSFPSIGFDASNPGVLPNKHQRDINAVHAWQDGNAQIVIVAGDFRRIANVTYNGIAWINTADSPLKWNAMGGGVGLHEITNDAVFKAPTSVGSLTSYVRPGRVFAMTSIAGTGKLGKTIFVGGAFQFSADTVLNNVAKYEFGDDASKKWVPLAGGVNGEVFAIDAVGSKKVYVGGQFTRAGNLTVRNIAMWDDDKKTWNAMQTGVAGAVRQIIAQGENNVMVVSDANEAGGVKSTINVHWWNGQRWSVLDCDLCTTACVSKNARSPGFCSGTTHELRYVNGRLYRRTAGAVQYYDNSQWRLLDQTSVGVPTDASLPTDAPRNLLARGLTGDRIFLGQVNANNANWSPNVAQIATDLNDYNVYPVANSGFDDDIIQVNGGSAVAPVVALLGLTLAVLALLF